MTSPKPLCIVCVEPLTDYTEAYCGSCGHPFHLNQRVDIPGKDCGQVWINDEHLGLEFGCFTCLRPPDPLQGALDDILDLAEAALALGLAAETLAVAADSGHVRHRRTGSGTYLFVRADLAAFSGEAR